MRATVEEPMLLVLLSGLVRGLALALGLRRRVAGERLVRSERGSRCRRGRGCGRSSSIWSPPPAPATAAIPPLSLCLWPVGWTGLEEGMKQAFDMGLGFSRINGPQNN